MGCNDVTPTPSSIFVNLGILLSGTPSSSISCTGICNNIYFVRGKFINYTSYRQVNRGKPWVGMTFVKTTTNNNMVEYLVDTQ